MPLSLSTVVNGAAGVNLSGSESVMPSTDFWLSGKDFHLSRRRAF